MLGIEGYPFLKNFFNTSHDIPPNAAPAAQRAITGDTHRICSASGDGMTIKRHNPIIPNDNRVNVFILSSYINHDSYVGGNDDHSYVCVV